MNDVNQGASQQASPAIGHPGKKRRIGIATVSLGLLDQWLHLPPGTRVVDVRSKDKGWNGAFEILIEGDAVPETEELAATPHVDISVTVHQPEVAITLRSVAAEVLDHARQQGAFD